MTPARYSAEVRRRCREVPRAGGWPIDDPAVVTGQFANTADDTRIQVQLRVEDGRVADARFKAFGCSVAVASGSLVAERADGQTLDGVRAIDTDAVVAALDLPDDKAVIAAGAVAAAQAAVDRWEARLAVSVSSTKGRRR